MVGEPHPTREDVANSLQKLHDKGVINLESRCRDAIPELARRMVRYREAERWWILASGANPHAVCECSF